MSTSSQSLPVAVLYTFGGSCWASVPRLTLIEKVQLASYGLGILRAMLIGYHHCSIACPTPSPSTLTIAHDVVMPCSWYTYTIKQQGYSADECIIKDVDLRKSCALVWESRDIYIVLF